MFFCILYIFINENSFVRYVWGEVYESGYFNLEQSLKFFGKIGCGFLERFFLLFVIFFYFLMLILGSQTISFGYFQVTSHNCLFFYWAVSDIDVGICQICFESILIFFFRNKFLDSFSIDKCIMYRQKKVDRQLPQLINLIIMITSTYYLVCRKNLAIMLQCESPVYIIQ